MTVSTIFIMGLHCH